MSMMRSLRPLAVAGGVALSLSAGAAMADEPFILDATQLDLVTGGDLITGFDTSSIANTQGFNVSNVDSIAQSQSNTGELISVATGSASGFALAIGADDGTPPSASVDTNVNPIPGTEGTQVLNRTVTIGRSNPVFAFEYQYQFAVAIDSSVIPRFNN